jgi:hypothetical protein
VARRSRYEREEVHKLKDGQKYVQLPSRRVYFWDAVDDARKAWTPVRRHILRAITLIADPDPNDDLDMHDYDLERLEWFTDELERWIVSVREEIIKKRGKLKIQERIALLRNTSGRTPEEAAAFNAKADQLEKEMGT